jgi:RNA polymerase sigma-70 factor (ECF subfamily)
LVGEGAFEPGGTGEQQDERRLVERARGGDGAAFGQLYQRYVDRVYSFVVFRVRDATLAEDLTQEVFLQALRAIDAFDWRGSLAPWLLRIARNAVIDHWRRTNRRPERTMSALDTADAEGDDEDGLDRIVSVPDESDLRAEQVLRRERIARAAQLLTELQQQVLALRFAAGLSIKETADVMGKSEGAVKNLQHHALKALKRNLEGQEDG